MKTAVISWRDSQSTPKERSLSTVLDICNKYSNLISEESIAYLRDVLRSLLVRKLIPYSARQERINA
ncbi:hypothetical protein [Nostoc sp.]|uniref:hypothetical protein n=1 Tax=Nostoc sp. TaxID=1180 RepID=UPI002FF641F2